MYFSLIILCASFSIFSCEAATIDYSNITPWSVVYTVYPIYDTDPNWVEVWKNERSLVLSDNTVDYGSNNHQSSDLHVNKDVINNDSQQTEHSNISRDNQDLNSNQQTQTHSWSLNYRNWPKNSNKPDH